MTRTEQQTLYDGEVYVQLRPKHQYFVSGPGVDALNPSEWVYRPSATTVVGVVDDGKVNAIKGWALKIMGNFLQEKANAEAFCRNEESRQEVIRQAKQAPNVFRDSAADYGNAVHRWIERFILGEEPDMPEHPMAVKAIEAFLRWQDANIYEWLATEKFVYSKKYKYTGTLDGLAELNVKGTRRPLVLVDFKTSTLAGTPPHRMQTALYQQAIMEEYTGEEVSERIILHIPRKGGGLNPIRSSNPDVWETTFEEDLDGALAARSLYFYLKGA